MPTPPMPTKCTRVARLDAGTRRHRPCQVAHREQAPQGHGAPPVIEAGCDRCDWLTRSTMSATRSAASGLASRARPRPSAGARRRPTQRGQRDAQTRRRACRSAAATRAAPRSTRYSALRVWWSSTACGNGTSTLPTPAAHSSAKVSAPARQTTRSAQRVGSGHVGDEGFDGRDDARVSVGADRFLAQRLAALMAHLDAAAQSRQRLAAPRC